MHLLTVAGKYRLHSMISLVTVSVHTCSHCCWKISVILNDFSCYCFRYMHVLTAAGKYRLHSMASLLTVSVHACSHCCRKISVTLNDFLLLLFPYMHVLTAAGKYQLHSMTSSCYCFRTCMFSLLLENIGYIQWLLFLLFSVHASTMSKLPKEMYPSLSQP